MSVKIGFGSLDRNFKLKGIQSLDLPWEEDGDWLTLDDDGYHNLNRLTARTLDSILFPADDALLSPESKSRSYPIKAIEHQFLQLRDIASGLPVGFERSLLNVIVMNALHTLKKHGDMAVIRIVYPRSRPLVRE